MSEIMKLTVIKSAVGNKIVNPDSAGYYKVTLGAFNVRNSSGDVYMFAGIPELLKDKTSVFNRRLLAGRLRAEAEHPGREPGMTDEQFIMRNFKILTTQSCAHIKEITIKETNSSENIPGVGNIVLVEGLVRPSGQYGVGLKSSLDNPDEDTCFSVRSITQDTPNGLHVIKRVRHLITWDWINEPGIKYASKLGKPAVESEDLQSFIPEDLTLVDTNFGCSTEANDQFECVNELIEIERAADIVSKW